jgi:hypothetical protein|tara:strand:+ start:421 stop:771 length:351 start_codon:yes stop_codon:yes gene_type:complete
MSNKTCAWCSKPTTLPAVFAADTPLIEWMEEKINMIATARKINRNLIWGVNSDWGKLELPPAFEAELLAYDELLSTVTRKQICKSCLVDDHKLWSKYYQNIIDDPGDIDIIFDELK